MRKLIVISAVIAAILTVPAVAGARSRHHRHHGRHGIGHAYRVRREPHRVIVRKADVEEVAEVECAPVGVECELPEVVVVDLPELLALPVEEEPS